MNAFKHLSLVLLLGLLCTTVAEAQKKNANANAASLKEDLALLMTMFSGEFDNYQQYYKEKEDKVKEPHQHIHSVFAPVKLPTFGENVLFVKQYLDGNPRKVYRQRLYVFNEDPTEKAIRLDIYSFKTDSLYADAHLKPDKLNGLTADKVVNTPGCAVYWKRDGDKFWGYMKDKACSVVSKQTNKKIFITDSLMLSRDELWIRDEATDEDGKYVFGHKGKIHHKLKKCQYYKGWWVLQQAGFNDKYDLNRNIVLHDQGGRVRLKDSTGRQMKYTIELSKVVFGKDMEVLKLALYEDGNDRAIDYTWTSPDARMIGMNLRWFQSGFTKIEPTAAKK
ncbi:MAG: chromophore lyase CpcT/CpeT [Runella sp.]